jgi:hypothetical protein
VLISLSDFDYFSLILLKLITPTIMKKLYFSLLSIAFVTGAHAQLTQTNHAPASGDQYQLYQCDSAGITPGASGAGNTWTFGVTTHSSILKSYTVSPVTNPNYPSAPLVISASSNDVSFVNSSSGSVLYYGGNIAVGTIVASLTYTAPAIYATYPLNLNTSSTTVIGGTINVTAPTAAAGTFTGNSKVIADATGTLTIAGKTYSNVMRVVATQTLNGTVGGFAVTIYRNDCRFYEIGMKAPVLSILSSTASTFAGNNYDLVVLRLNPVIDLSGISKTAGDASPEVFPNPATSEVNFISQDRSAKLVSIYDLTGRLVTSQAIDNGKVTINVASYGKGLYTYKITGDDNSTVRTGKLTVSQ